MGAKCNHKYSYKKGEEGTWTQKKEGQATTSSERRERFGDAVRPALKKNEGPMSQEV